VTESFLLSIICSLAVCLVVASAMIMLARQSISVAAAYGFAFSFLVLAGTLAAMAVLPYDWLFPGARQMLINTLGALGMTALWASFWARGGHHYSWHWSVALFSLWALPALLTFAMGLADDPHLPFAAASICLGAASGVHALWKKRGAKNSGDAALIIWLLLVLPASAAMMIAGVDTSRPVPTASWLSFLHLLPVVLAGIGVFTLLGFTLDAIRDSEELALTDGLTGLLNRRAFDRELSVATARAERYQRELSLMVLDIDRFKNLNDRFGHPAGDMIIRAVANVLQAHARRVDVAARIGGEEFALILPDTPSAAALRLAERLRTAIMHESRDGVPITASFGVAHVQDTGPSAEALLAAADSAMYAAKNAGRNRVRHAANPDRDPGALFRIST
jgi:diguanylate cyclase (GGDEF)-like protein